MVCSRFAVLLIFTACGLAVATEQESDVIQISDENVQVLSEGEWLVMFYAPWCGHCKRFEPVYERIATAFLKKSCHVGKINGDANKATTFRWGVHGFPTLLYIRDGVIRKYEGPRDLASVTTYVDGGWKDTSPVEHNFLTDPFGIASRALTKVIELAAYLQAQYDALQAQTGLSHTVMITLSVIFTIVSGIGLGAALSLLMPAPKARAPAARPHND
mmetsp:Transcript_71646/g.168737  ORF Transcript_71646/g.168737 Transcript_71646/m.168737 type:complete len:216 (+) Transcript_71646:3-650(+)